MTESVVETTRTEVSVEEVTETRYECHVCEMLYDDEEVIRIGLDRQARGESLFDSGAAPRAERTICHHCADGLFAYDAGESDVFAESETPVQVDWVAKMSAYATILTLLAITTAGFATAVAYNGGTTLTVPAAVAAAVGAFVLRGWVS